MKNFIITTLVAILAFILGMVSWSTAMAYMKNYQSIDVDELYSIPALKKKKGDCNEEIKDRKIGF